MKTVVSVIFGVLTAAVLGAGSFLWLRIRKQNRSLLDERRDLQASITQLQDDLSDWIGFPEDYETMHAELDSIRDTLSVIETGLAGYLKGMGVSRLVLDGPEEVADYRSYSYSFQVTGKPDEVDSMLIRLHRGLPFFRIDVFQATPESRRLDLELSGDIRFPR